jgi:hypothetical protein
MSVQELASRGSSREWQKFDGDMRAGGLFARHDPGWT